MKKFLKIAGLVLGGLIACVLLLVGVVYVLSQRRIDTHLSGVGHTVPIPTDPATVARGQHVVNAFGMCGDCHRNDFGGGSIIEIPGIATLYALNLTRGKGGVGATLSDADWERAVRHGVAPDGRKLLFMPSHEYSQLNDDDFSAAAAYLKQVPNVDRETKPASIGPLFRALFLKGDLELLPADLMDHKAAHPAVIAPAPTVEYGRYLSTTCRGCHGKTFSGGPIPGAPPEFRAPANITPAGIGKYSEADFVTALREGKRPGGVPLDTAFMPVRFTKNLTDVELKALYAFLKTLPPKEYGGR